MSLSRMVGNREGVLNVAITFLLIGLISGQVYGGDTEIGPNDTWEINPPFCVVKYGLQNDANLDGCIYQAAAAMNFHSQFELQQGPPDNITVMRKKN